MKPPASEDLGIAAERLLAELARRGFGESEVYEKRGRSRSIERAADRETRHAANEAGWAVRAGDTRRSLFHAATGAPDPDVTLADASPHPLLLPDAWAGEPWSDPAPASSQLATENEVSTLFDGIERRLALDCPGARLVHARLDDGASESFLVSTRGARARTTRRVAWLRVEAVGENSKRVELSLAEREARRFRPEPIVSRLAERLRALGGVKGESSSTEQEAPTRWIFAAPLAARLVEGLAPLFAGRHAAARLAPLGGSDGLVAAPCVALVDDGRLAPEAGGILSAAFDGEGLPTGRTSLIEAGKFRGALLASWEGAGRSPGCARRASWRDLPRRAASHCFLLPGEVAAREMVSSAGEAIYLIDSEGAVEVDGAALTFRAPVSGFALRAGAVANPLGPRRLVGSLSTLLRSIRELGSDLTFVPGDGMFGSPTLRVETDGTNGELRLLPVGPR